jgi:hypothetical protein
MLAVLPTSSDLDPRTSEVRGITTQTELSVTGRLRVRVRVLQSHRAVLRGTAVHRALCRAARSTEHQDVERSIGSGA